MWLEANNRTLFETKTKSLVRAGSDGTDYYIEKFDGKEVSYIARDSSREKVESIFNNIKEKLLNNNEIN